MKTAIDKLQQQLAKRQQAKTKLELRARISEQQYKVDVAKYELEKTQADLLNAKIALYEVPETNKIERLRAKAKIKAVESRLFENRAELYTEQDELKALKTKPVKTAPIANIDETRDAIKQSESPIIEVAPVNIELTATSLEQLEEKIVDSRNIPEDLTESEIDMVDNDLTNAILGHFFQIKWPDEHQIAFEESLNIDVSFKNEAYSIIVTTDWENQFYLHAAYFSVNGGQITDTIYFREIYQTEKSRDKKSDIWLNQT
ncbi:hypothetical protein PN36_20675 [Candidatus Thiomargarita nelsonii]|uniref:Uncharacterized protein n=1 Tax=Candidatus Thiomargarita nelsonii TaxID=1003181 RepID=A0A0A6P2G3_9GAMM|nr:hypothetical protein PN36_20675 [Candidatus Thiomargarita nelsonii]